MKVVIAGSRDLDDFDMVCKAIEDSGFEITEVVSGGAKGADALGEQWAKQNKIPIKKFPADWKNLKAEGAVIKDGPYGKYNVNAGFARNKDMAEYCDALIAINLGTNGTDNMVAAATELNKKVYEAKVKKDESKYRYVF